jgi:hypothetical protein
LTTSKAVSYHTLPLFRGFPVADVIPWVDSIEALPVAMVHDEVGHKQVGEVVLIGKAFKSFLEKNYEFLLHL